MNTKTFEQFSAMTEAEPSTVEGGVAVGLNYVNRH
ncbi:hypothetical protein SAMN05216385_0997 [Streptococcus equinus]|nr:hypothetical protein SAMN05216385_0997 [Streptococcus equinus]